MQHFFIQMYEKWHRIVHLLYLHYQLSIYNVPINATQVHMCHNYVYFLKFCISLTNIRFFGLFVMLVILVNCIFMAIQTEIKYAEWVSNDIYMYFDFIIMIQIYY